MLALQAFEQHWRQRPIDVLQQQRLLATMSSRLTAQQAAACEGPNEDGFLTLG
jgi:hypothetical protein